MSFIDQLSDKPSEDRDTQRTEMFHKLKSFGLTSQECWVLVYTFVHNWSLSEIAEKVGAASRQAVFEIRKRSLGLLKERGYK